MATNHAGTATHPANLIVLALFALLTFPGCERSTPAPPPRPMGPTNLSLYSVISDSEGRLVLIDSNMLNPLDSSWTLVSGQNGTPTWASIEISSDPLATSDSSWMHPPIQVGNATDESAIVADQSGFVIALSIDSSYILVSNGDGMPVWKELLTGTPIKPGKPWLRGPLIIAPTNQKQAPTETSPE